MSSLVSARVRKRFGRAWFCGTVTEEWRCSQTGTVYAHVLYDDGDEEDLEVEQARLLLLGAKAPSSPAPAAAAAVAPPAAFDFGGSGKAAAGVKRRHGHALLTDYVQPGAVKTERPAVPEAAVEVEPPAKRKFRELRRLEFEGAPGTEKLRARVKTAPREAGKKPGKKPRSKAAAAAAPKAKGKRVALSREEKEAQKAAREAEKAEAVRLATERGYSAPEPGSRHVATLRGVTFATGTAEASPALVHWTEGVPALLSRLGPHPALHTVLRRVGRTLFKDVTKEQRAEQVKPLIANVRMHSTLRGVDLAPAIDQLKAFLAKHSPKYRAAVGKARVKKEAVEKEEEEEDDEAMEVDTGAVKDETGEAQAAGPPLAVGSIVRLRTLEPGTSLVNDALRLFVPSAKYFHGVVANVINQPPSSEGGPTRQVVVVSGPKWPNGTDSNYLQRCTSFDPACLITEEQALKEMLGRALSDLSAWEAPECFEDVAEPIGTSLEFTFAQLCLPLGAPHKSGVDDEQADEVVEAFKLSGVQAPMERRGKDCSSKDEADVQNLATVLYNDVWVQRDQGSAPAHRLGVTMSNLAAVPGNPFAFTADLEVWLPAREDRFASSDKTTDLVDTLMFKRPVFSLPALGTWLMLFNDRLKQRVEEFRKAEAMRPPGTANGMLRLAEKNGWQLEAPTPQGLAVQLKPFQRQSLAWMMAEEAGEGALSHVWWAFRTRARPAGADGELTAEALAPGLGTTCAAWFSPVLSSFRFRTMPRVCGGWLAEAMGLGKTIVTLGLIMNDHPAPPPKAAKAKAAAGGPSAVLTYVPQPLSGTAARRAARADKLYEECYNKADELIKSKATLVVAPLSLVSQWGDEAARHVLKLPSGASLRVVRWYGNSRVRDPEKVVETADLVLTTYDTVAASFRMDDERGEYKKYVADTKREYAHKVEKAKWRGLPAPKEKQLRQKQRATLHEILWHRVVFDESQYLRDGKAIRTHACQALRSQRRWLLSGTPVNTQPDDLLGQFSVLSPQLHRSLVAGCAFHALFKGPFEFTQADVARGYATPELELHRGEFKQGFAAMPWLLPRLMIRHASGQVVGGEVVGALPKKTEQVVLVTLDSQERAVYNKVEAEMRRRFGEMEAMGAAVVQKSLFFAMSLLTPLRKLCSGGTFLPEKDLVATRMAMNRFKTLAVAPQSLLRVDVVIDNDPAGATCACCGLDPEQGVRTKCCFAWCCHDCLADKAQEDEATCPQCTAPLKPGDVPSPWASTGLGFSGESGPAQPLALPAPATAAVDVDPCGAVEMQSKLRIVLAELAKVRDEDEHAKTLIFSQYSHSLQWLAAELVKHEYQHATITGSMSLQQRAAALKAFQTAKPTTIFLLNLRVAAVGLNLTAASHVILLEPCMNPALEEQAIGRVYRMGQTRETLVKRLVIVDSVESRLREVVAGKVAAGLGDRVALAAGTSGANKLNAKVPTVAGAMKQDKGFVKYDELRTLFGLPPREGAEPEGQQVLQLAAAADGDMDD